MRYLIGIDNGGTFSKAAIFDEEGNQIAVSSVPTVTITPKPGYTERDMDELWRVNAQAVRTAIQKSGIDPKDIAGVSFSGHGKGLYMIDGDGNPSYHGILSTDARAWKYVENWYKDGTNKKVHEKTVQEILACQPVSILAWFQENHPEVLEKTKYIFAVKDYIRYKLTGEAFAEYTDFSGANLVNLHTKSYDKELMELFGLGDMYEKLPPLKHSAEISGHITAKASDETLIPEGVPVAAGMFDVNACGIASGLASEKDMCMVAGTWSINEFIGKNPIDNGTVALNSMFCMPGYFLIEESSPTSAGNMEWFIRTLLDYEKKAAKEEGRSVYDITNEWVASIEPQDSNVIFLPFLNGSNEDALAKGTFVGLTAYHNKKHMLRAVYEGIVFSHLTHVKKLLRNRQAPKSIRLSGGAANSDVWVQIFADALQIPVDTVGDKELGAQGAAIAAGIAAGVYKDYQEAISRTVKITKTVNPRPEYKEIYEEKYATYRAVIDGLSKAWEHFKN
ncbi:MULTISPECIES: FGGY-family carbohydrate kinase [Clostridium]|uniref:Carbohydrate kinase n=1 Tax=Clostridium porci TaxID=2605778 RepID=A0A7X2NIG4_9CLOT|nr:MULTISPECIES: FGGY-family carbohydrate kinase [Clostridium]MCI6139615.1 carbohydrate kinase [Clostridium sp.]MSS35385.1 carbohydrate kinase [Clostridium porci]